MIKNLSPILFIGLLVSGYVSTYGQCTPISTFLENFDAYSCCAMGVVPDCWNSITTPGGNQIISSTSPASGTSNVYQFGYGAGKISIVIMPQLSNINAGTHHFKFKARVNMGSSGLLDFGYITDAADASTFVILQPLTITNNSYDTSSERILTVPTTVPANARLAIRNPGTTFAGHYWDDASWEPILNLGTDENHKIDAVKIHPNPFKDIISMSDLKNVELLTVVDMSGRLVKTIVKPSSKINLSDLKSGVYFVNIQSKDEKSQSFKIIKE